MVRLTARKRCPVPGSHGHAESINPRSVEEVLVLYPQARAIRECRDNITCVHNPLW